MTPASFHGYLGGGSGAGPGALGATGPAGESMGASGSRRWAAAS